MNRWFVRRFDPEERYGLRLSLLIVALVVLGVPFSLLLLAVVSHGPLTRWDLHAAQSLHQRVHGRVMIDGLQSLSLIGRPPVLAVAVVIAATFVWRRGRRRLVVYLIATALGGGIVDSLVKLAVHRSRPVLPHPIAHAHGYSFPSGHAMSSLVAYGAITLALIPFARSVVVRRLMVAVVVVVLIAIGVSRVALGVHFVSDVLGGWILGAAWLAGSTAVFAIWRGEEGADPELAGT